MSARSLRGATAIAGINLIQYKRGASPDPERKLILRAIVGACEDARIDPSEIDGFCSFGDDRHDGPALGGSLGIKELRLSNMVWNGGGGGLAAAIANGAAAIAAGQADCVAVYRGLAEKDSGRLSAAVSMHHRSAHHFAGGVVSPTQTNALRIQRMIEHDGVPPSAAFALVSACYHHARSNPQAVGYGNQFSAEVYEASRFISEPLRLFDCSRENDGAGAIIIVSAERAADLARKPAYILAAAQGAPAKWGDVWENRPDYGGAGYRQLASRLWQASGYGPDDVRVAQVYDNFSGAAVASIIDHGFTTVEEAGAFFQLGNLIAPTGRLAVNTSGGALGEGFIHGIGMAVEAVRQIRGDSPNTVPDADLSLLISGAGTPVNSNLLLGSANAL